MSHVQTINIPVRVFEHLQEVLRELDDSSSIYKPEFLARMYRARASDLEKKGKTLTEIKKRFTKN